MSLTVRPLTPARFADLEAVFNARGCSVARNCWRMYYRVSGKGGYTRPGDPQVLQAHDALKALAAQDPPAGLLGYRGKTPVGWVSLGPRADYARLARSRAMKAVDGQPVWSIVCFVVPDQPGLGAHTDYGMFTLLVADPVPGLQLLGGDEWHDVIPPAGTITCNIGDMLAMWTNDRWVSTMHRVAPPSGTADEVRRRSIARFLDGDPSMRLAPIPSCVAPGEAPRYPEVVAGDWLMAKIIGGQAGAPVDLHDGGLTGATNR